MKLPVLVLASVLAVVLTGCSSPGLPYDPRLVEGDILDLAARTREMVADGDKGRLTAAASRKFLEQSKAMADLIRVRSAGDEAQLACLAALDQQYGVLLQRRVVLRSKNTVPLRAALTALVAVRPRYVAYTETPSTIVDTTTDDLMDRERCRQLEKERKEREREKNDDRKGKDKDNDDDDDKKGKKD